MQMVIVCHFDNHALTDTANRYGSIQLSFFPELDTRLGFESANNQLDQRDPERDAQALRAYNVVEESFADVDRNSLSEAKKTEYEERFGARIHIISEDVLEISSTEIRERIDSGADLTGLLPVKVIEIIRQERLYGVE